MINTERMFEKREEAEPHADTGKSFNRKKKLNILSDAAKYDAACTSSGVGRKGKEGKTAGWTASATVLPRMGAVSPAENFYLRTSASMTVITVSTVGQ